MQAFSLGGRRDDRLQIHVNYWHHPVAASKDPQMRPWLLIDRPVMKKYNRDDKKGLIDKIEHEVMAAKLCGCNLRMCR